MATVEVCRTLVKSSPELWATLEGDALPDALGGATITATEPERELHWTGEGASGTAVLEPSCWGTRVTLTAEVEEEVAQLGFWAQMRRQRPAPARSLDVERKLSALLDDLGSAQRKPFAHK